MKELPRREREILEILCAKDGMSAAEVRSRMDDAPSDSAVRALLRRLELRGLVTHREQGKAFLYRPTRERDSLRKSALTQLVSTFFQGSAVGAATALLGMSGNVSDAEISELQNAIDQARKRKT